MARIRNTGIPNTFGDGYEQEIELDNGKKYRIRNSGIPNTFGKGYEKEIEEITADKSRVNPNEPFTLIELLVFIFITIPAILLGLVLVAGVIILPLMTIFNI